MTVRPLQSPDRDQWVELRRALWPDHPPEEILAEAAALAASNRDLVLVAEGDGGAIVGFAEVFLRPYARGCGSSPVGYLEGWYVVPDHRRQGVGAALLAAAEEWARQRGCTEFASDRDADNELSRTAHRGTRFEPADANECFRKPLAPETVPARDFIGLMPAKLDGGAIERLVRDTTAGGVAVFLGTTRDEIGPDGRPLVALDYEAYPEMAEKQLRDLAAQARQRWPIVKLAILHRTGRVAPAEPSVVIAVSTPHRAESFDACRFLIDALKKDVAIWKKEVWADGGTSWVHP